AVKTFDQTWAGEPLGHDVADDDFSATEPSPRYGIHLFAIAEHMVDFRHGGTRLSLGLRGTAGHDDACIRLLAADSVDGLAGLAHGLAGNRAGVDHDGIARARCFADCLRLVGIEPAAEGDDVDAHTAPALANRPGSNVPSYSYSTGPVISTWSSL